MKDERETPGQRGSFARRGDASTGGGSSFVRGLPQKERAPGDVLAGKYQIVGRLGVGGMGTVWRARSLWLDVDVAIKVLHEERFDVHAAERLLREARATARLGHPAIVRVFDFGETESGEPFLVMELLEGVPLSSWLERRGRMPAEQAVQMLLPVACALAAAHAQSVVHRDIKPANILIVPDGAGGHVPKVVDFGIAKVANVHSPAITQRGVIVGSPESMSPEQADGALEVGEQADVWAFCVVLYELITGRRPFSGESLSAVIAAIFNKEPVPTTELAAGDDALWQILRRGLAKSPAERWPSMRALGRALASWAVERGITADVAGTSLTHHWLARGAEPQVAAGGAVTQATRVGVASGPCGARRPSGTEATVTAASPAGPVGRRGGTLRMDALPSRSRAEPTPPRRLQKALFFGGLAVCVVAMVAIVGLDVRGGGTGTGAPVAAAAAFAEGPEPASAPAPVIAAPAISTAVPEVVAASPVTATPRAASPVTATPRAASPVTATPRAASPVTATPRAASPVTATPRGAPPVTATPRAVTPAEAAADVVRDGGGAPRAAASDTAATKSAPESEARARRASQPARQVPVSMSMPLPAVPDF